MEVVIEEERKMGIAEPGDERRWQKDREFMAAVLNQQTW